MNDDCLPPGTILGELRVERVLGRGGYGVVYLAHDEALNRRVALKEFWPQALAQRVDTTQIVLRSPADAAGFRIGLEAFLDEARLLARFDHASLVRVHRFWEQNGTAYLSMPWIEGRTLQSMRQAMAAPPDEAWLRERLLRPLLDVLSTMHAVSCLHRDISPTNILMAHSGRPVLLDLGSARRVQHDMTQPLTAVANPAYAPLELFAEGDDVRQGPWTDIYSLAAVLVFAITGEAPTAAPLRAVQRGNGLVQQVRQALALHRRPPYSDAFIDALDRALAVRPAERLPGAQEWLDALQGQPRWSSAPAEALPPDTAAVLPGEPPTAPEDAPGALRAERPGPIPVEAEPAGGRPDDPVGADADAQVPAGGIEIGGAQAGDDEEAIDPEVLKAIQVAVHGHPRIDRPGPIGMRPPPIGPMAPAGGVWNPLPPGSPPAPAGVGRTPQPPVARPASATVPTAQHAGATAPATDAAASAADALADALTARRPPPLPPRGWRAKHWRPVATVTVIGALVSTAWLVLVRDDDRRLSVWLQSWAAEIGLADPVRVANSSAGAQPDEDAAPPVADGDAVATGSAASDADAAVDRALAAAALLTREPTAAGPPTAGDQGAAQAPVTSTAEPDATPKAARPGTEPARAASPTMPPADVTPPPDGAPTAAAESMPSESPDETPASGPDAAAAPAAVGAGSPDSPSVVKATPTRRAQEPARRTPAPTSPREVCGARTNFSLYYCMQQQCARSAWTAHPQCRRLREDDVVD